MYNWDADCKVIVCAGLGASGANVEKTFFNVELPYKGQMILSAKIQTVYEMLGGEEPIRKLVDLFYAKVYQDPVLRPMFPDDIEESKRRQFLFLVQFFGGPRHYSQERGHPRLRMRHFPFAIDRRARDHWLRHMLEAIDEAGIDGLARERMREYFDRASAFLINRHDDIQLAE